jgi:riboflavin kinase/FMN adenylyltransferase
VNVLDGFTDLVPMPGPTVATVGNFDGVHIGHQRIFARVRERAAALGIPAVAVSFDPHPLTILAPPRAPRMILTRRQKTEILAGLGVDTLVFLPFTAEIARMEPESFIEEFLARVLRIHELYIGVDFRFGLERRGDLDLLQRFGAARGFAVESVEIVLHNDERVSASLIRKALARGDVRSAREMMGRPYVAIGEVVRGAGRGRTQGSPTANLAVENEMVPGTGVYITQAELAGRSHPSLTNIGTRPTFEGAGFAVETWLPDFSGDLYGQSLRVAFLERLRDEIKFPSPAALQEQIARDLASMRAYFVRRNP